MRWKPLGSFSLLLVAREILLCGDYVRGTKLLAFVVCCIALAISALYELIEWAAALSMEPMSFLAR